MATGTYTTRRALILPVVLLILLLIGLLGAMFSFRVNADLASTRAVAAQLQTRLAAEAGVERVKLLLRRDRFNRERWYHNPDELHRIIVWTHGTDPTIWGTNEEFSDDAALTGYRFSIVADDPTDDEQYIRIGINDEASRLNLNTATEEQLLALFTSALPPDDETNPQLLVDAVLDWRDADSVARGEAGDTEVEYYRSLDKPYAVKNGPFDTVEELLLVKGITPEVLYGEDFDRNGLLTPNEDDGDESLPMDDQDGLLNRGLYPFLTVWSKESNVATDNRPRTYLFGDEPLLRQELTAAFGAGSPVVDFVVKAVKQQSAGGGQGGQGGSNNAGGGGAQGPVGRQGRTPPGGSGQGQPGQGNAGGQEGKPDGGVNRKAGFQQPGPGSEPPDEEEEDEEESLEDDEDESPGSGEGGADESNDESGEPGAGEGGEGAPTGPRPITSPASLLLVQVEDQGNPLTVEDLPVLLDRFTTRDPEKEREVPGLININTAPRQVLACLGLSEEQIGAALDARPSLSLEAGATPAWLVSSGVVDLDTFEAIAPQITARSQQFRIESLGFADHIGTVTRLEVIVDMMGPIPQTIYYRDISQLGANFPIREKDLEYVRDR